MLGWAVIQDVNITVSHCMMFFLPILLPNCCLTYNTITSNTQKIYIIWELKNTITQFGKTCGTVILNKINIYIPTFAIRPFCTVSKLNLVSMRSIN